MKPINDRVRMHWPNWVGVGGVALLAIVVAGLNLFGWNRTLPGAAGQVAGILAFCFEAMAFVLWEVARSHFAARRWWSFGGAAFALLLAVVINVEGGHRGLEQMAQPLFEQAEDDRKAQQELLDRDRSTLAMEIATLQARVDSVPLDLSGGPQSDTQARLAWNDQTIGDRNRISQKREELDAMPLTIAARQPFPAWAPYASAGVFVYFSVFGLSIFGVRLPGTEAKEARAPRKPNPPQEAPQTAPNVIDLGTKRGKRGGREADLQTVKRLSAAGLSTREIERETNGRISKSRAQRLLKAS